MVGEAILKGIVVIDFYLNSSYHNNNREAMVMVMTISSNKAGVMVREVVGMAINNINIVNGNIGSQ